MEDQPEEHCSSQPRNDKGLDKKLRSMLCQEGPDFLMLCSANLQDRAVFAMCSLKVSWSSKITPRFLTEVDGVIIDVPN